MIINAVARVFSAIEIDMQSPERFPLNLPDYASAARRTYRLRTIRKLEEALLQPAQPPRRSPEEQALLNAVVAQPDEDAPRLAYANWFELHGDPDRAEFVRLQLSGQHPDREKKLLQQQYTRWLDDFSTFAVRDLQYQRGFVDEVTTTGRTFISLGDSLFRCAPIQKIRLIASALILPELPNATMGTKLRALSLRNERLGDRGLSSWMQNGHLSQLQQLDFSGNRLTVNGLQNLMKWERFPQLTKLQLNENAFGEVQSLHFFTDLELNELQLQRSGINTEFLAGWLRYSPKLESLDVAGNVELSSNLDWLATLKHLPLQSLSIAGIPINKERIQLPDHLKHLNVQRTFISVSDLIQFLDQSKGLTSFYFGNNGYNIKESEMLVNALQLQPTQYLHLQQNQLNAASIERLWNRQHFPYLSDLNLSGIDWPTSLVEADAPALTRFNLSYTNATETTLLQLLDSSIEQSLESLDLSGTRIGPSVAKLLLSPGRFPHLQELHCVDCRRLDRQWIHLLQERFN